MIIYHKLNIFHLWREGQLGYLRQQVKLEGFQEQSFQVPSLRTSNEQLWLSTSADHTNAPKTSMGIFSWRNQTALKIHQPWHIYPKFMTQVGHRDLREEIPCGTCQAEHPWVSRWMGRGCFPSRMALAKAGRWPAEALWRALAHALSAQLLQLKAQSRCSKSNCAQ